jgi:hypothetical protein
MPTSAVPLILPHKPLQAHVLFFFFFFFLEMQLTGGCAHAGRSHARVEPSGQDAWAFSGTLDLSTEGTEMKQSGYAGLQPRKVGRGDHCLP